MGCSTRPPRRTPRLLALLVLSAAAPACTTVTAFDTMLDRELSAEGRAYLASHPVRMVVHGSTVEHLDGVWAGESEPAELITVERRHQYPPCSNYLMVPLAANLIGIFGWAPGLLVPFWYPDAAEVRVTQWDGSYEISTWEPAGTTRVFSLLSWFLWVRPDYEFGDVDSAEVERRVFVTMVNRLAAKEKPDVPGGTPGGSGPAP